MPVISHLGVIADGSQQYQPALDVMQAAVAALGSRGAIIGLDADFVIPVTASYVVIPPITASHSWSLPNVDDYPFGQDLLIADEGRLLGSGSALTVIPLAGSGDAIAGFSNGIILADAGASVRLRRGLLSDVWVLV